MKKLLSFLLATLMTLSLIPPVALPASAAKARTTSAAENTATLGTLSKITDDSFESKFSEDSRRELYIPENVVSGGAGDTLTFNYSCGYIKKDGINANGYISVMLADADDNMLYYGKMADVDADDNVKVGTFDLTLPNDLAEGEYTLKFFNEPKSGDSKSYYYDVYLTVKSEDNVVLGTSVLKGKQKTNILFGTYEQSSNGKGGYNVDPIKWNVLSTAFKYNDDDQNSIFLLSDKILDMNNYHATEKNVTWQGSSVRLRLNNTFYETAFSDREQKIVLDTKVKNVTYYHTDGSTGLNYESAGNDTVDKVFLLSWVENKADEYFSRIGLDGYLTEYAFSKKEFYKNNPNLYTNEWWLRTNGYASNLALVNVFDDSAFTLYRGAYVTHQRGIRPAFNLDPTTVLFTTAATGGKSNRKGLFKNGINHGNDYKLTLKDSTLVFSLKNTPNTSLKNGETVRLPYTASNDAFPNCVSAMIVNDDNRVLYYGMLEMFESEAFLTVPDDLATGTYTLHVFLEERNGDGKTDYASEFETLTIDVTKNTLTADDFTFFPPEELTYDGKAKAATFTSSKGGVGTIRVKYYDEESGRQIDEPTEIGTYTVRIDVEEGTGCLAATDLTAADWKFTIVKNENHVLLGADVLSDYDKKTESYQYIYYGVNKDTGAPIKWRILSTDGNGGTYTDGDGNSVADKNALFLVSEYALKQMTYNTRTANAGQNDNPANWRYSNAWSWCNDTTDADSFISGSFTADERKHILKTSKANGASYGGNDELIGDSFFFLTKSEIDAIKNESGSLYVGVDNGKNDGKGASVNWWLRYPTNKPYVGIVYEGVFAAGDVAAINLYARPAFNLNKNSILFTTPAKGKQIDVGTLSENGKTTAGEYKLTVKDSDRKFTVTQAPSGAKKGELFTFNYKNAETGANEYLSAMILRDGKVLYYGQIMNVTAASGEASFKLPKKLDYGTYELRLFNEQINGDYKTDYSSDFQTVTLRVADLNTPTVSDFTFTPPADLAYDGNAKAASVTTSKTGLGAITVKYYDESGTLLTSEPVLTGTYTVKIDVAEGTEYFATTDLTADDWKFSIVKTGKNITLGTAALSGYDSINEYDYIYYGTYGNAPVKWRVLDMAYNYGGNDSSKTGMLVGTSLN